MHSSAASTANLADTTITAASIDLGTSDGDLYIGCPYNSPPIF